MSRAMHDTYNACDAREQPTAAFVIDYAHHGFPTLETSTHVVPHVEVAASRARQEGCFGFWHIKPKIGGAA